MMPRDLGKLIGGTPQAGVDIGFPLPDLHSHLPIWTSLQAVPPIEASPVQIELISKLGSLFRCSRKTCSATLVEC